MTDNSKIRPGGYLAFVAGLMVSGLIALSANSLLLFRSFPAAAGDMVITLLFLAAVGAVFLVEPAILGRSGKFTVSVLRRRILLDFAPLIVAVVFRSRWDLSNWLIMLCVIATAGLHMISLWTARTGEVRPRRWPVVFPLLAWFLLLTTSGQGEPLLILALLSLFGGLIFLRRDKRLWPATETVASLPALVMLVIALPDTTTRWWITAGAILLGVGRLWAYPKWKLRRGYGVMMLAACLTFALLFEISLRASPLADAFESRHFSSSVQNDDILFWVHKDVYRGDSDFGVGRVKIRGRDVPRRKTPGVQRVLCCGGSSTFGVNLEPEQAWPHIAEQILRERGLSVEMLNAGEPGYTIFQILLLLQHYMVSDYAPDGVVLYVGYNDSSLTRGRYSERELWGMWQQARAGDGAWQTHARQTMQHSRAYNLLAHVLVGARHRMRDRSIPIASPHEFSETLSELLDYLKQKNIKALVASEAFQGPAEMYRRVMQRQAEIHGAGFVDVHDILLKQYDPTVVHTDVVHLTPKGNEVVARIIADAWASQNAEGAP